MDQVPPPVQTEPAKPETNAWREILSTLGILLTALLVALFIIGFIFRSYQVDGPSMENTLHDADKLIIWKVPRSWARITRHAYIPQRGDIVVFNESGLSEFGQEDSKQLIKRVIALPGERVVIAGGQAKVYNSTSPGGFMPDQTLPYGSSIPPTTSGNVDIQLKKDEIFVMGDNRPDSLDSRALGPIKADQLVGKLVLRLFPVSQAKAF